MLNLLNAMKQRLKEKRNGQMVNLIIAMAAISLVSPASVDALPFNNTVLHAQANIRASTSNPSALEVFKGSCIREVWLCESKI